jgi:hypothetical protein
MEKHVQSDRESFDCLTAFCRLSEWNGPVTALDACVTPDSETEEIPLSI